MTLRSSGQRTLIIPRGYRLTRETTKLIHLLRTSSVFVDHADLIDRGLLLAERYGFPIYDAMIVASALLARCVTLYSEDMQDGQVIDG
jgi:predicted nucleic acid-binding protein